MPKACAAPPDMLLAVRGCSNAAHRSKAATLATRPSTPCRPQTDLVLGSVLNGPCDRCWPITLFDRHADGTRSERRSFAAVSGVRSAGLATSTFDLNKHFRPQQALLTSTSACGLKKRLLSHRSFTRFSAPTPPQARSAMPQPNGATPAAHSAPPMTPPRPTKVPGTRPC